MNRLRLFILALVEKSIKGILKCYQLNILHIRLEINSFEFLFKRLKLLTETDQRNMINPFFNLFIRKIMFGNAQC